MKRLLMLVAALSLAACSPRLQADPAPASEAYLSRDGASILLNNPGASPLIAPVVRLSGPGLILGAPCAKRAADVYGCILPDVPGGQNYRLTPTAGHVDTARADYYPNPAALIPSFVKLPR